MSGYELVIKAGSGNAQYWKDVWGFRELFYILAWRDVVVMYKQTVIGIAWSVIRPLLTMVIFTVIFGRIAKLPSEGTAPYALMVFCATLPWQFFSTSLTNASNSVVGNARMITKVYFPRVIVPASAVVVSFVDFAISFGILVALMAWYRYIPSWQIVFLPLLVVVAGLASLGAGLWFAALNVKYRDFRYIVPFVVQFGLYVSPVGFSSSLVPERYRLLYSLNPMVGVIDGFRWAILGSSSSVHLPGFVLSLVVVGVLCWGGVKVFRQMERDFADVI